MAFRTGEFHVYFPHVRLNSRNVFFGVGWKSVVFVRIFSPCWMGEITRKNCPYVSGIVSINMLTRWWFPICLFSPLFGEGIPIWLIFYKWIGSSTNVNMWHVCFSHFAILGQFGRLFLFKLTTWKHQLVRVCQSHLDLQMSPKYGGWALKGRALLTTKTNLSTLAILQVIPQNTMKQHVSFV